MEAHQPEIAVLTVAQEAAVVAVVAAADGVAEADIMDAATVDMAVRGTNRLRKNPISLLFLGATTSGGEWRAGLETGRGKTRFHFCFGRGTTSSLL